MPDMVNQPPHYTAHPAGIEAIDVIRHATNYNLGTALKYIWRVMWGGKGDDMQDISKAIWYLQDWKKNHASTSQPAPPEHLVFNDPAEEHHALRGQSLDRPGGLPRYR